MGLDITAYRRLSRSGVDKEEALDGDYFIAYVNPDFPGRADDIPAESVWEFAEEIGFRAGSYSGYNRWRESLAKLAGYPLARHAVYGREEEAHAAACWQGATGPFSELINFSDCEGVIGPVTSAKLAADFAAFDARASALGDEWFYEKYREWRRAFEMAADGGAVELH